MPIYTGPYRPLLHFLVPSFFALSGFLVAGSLLRTNSLPTFLTLRFLRIFPALICEVIISAIIIGAALTTLPLAEYFSDWGFRHYFLNILGDIQYVLPGVFTHHPAREVNVQLWTIPYELECYILLTVAGLFALQLRPRLFLILVALLTVILTAANFSMGISQLGDRPGGRFVVCAFLWGVALFLSRDKIFYNVYLFVASLALTWIFLSYRETEYLAAPVVAYATVYIGLHNFRKSHFLLAGDISYGLYLYGFAIQQATYQLLPSMRSWHANFLISLAVASVFGYLSWTLVESKVMNYKKPAIKFVLSITDRIWPLFRRRSTT